MTVNSQIVSMAIIYLESRDRPLFERGSCNGRTWIIISCFVSRFHHILVRSLRVLRSALHFILNSSILTCFLVKSSTVSISTTLTHQSNSSLTSHSTLCCSHSHLLLLRCACFIHDEAAVNYTWSLLYQCLTLKAFKCLKGHNPSHPRKVFDVNICRQCYISLK